MSSSQSSGSPRTVTTELGEKVESRKKVKQSANYFAQILALQVQTNLRIPFEACQQVKKMLPAGMKDADIIALELLSDLDRTSMVLLSCTTEVQGFPKSRDWEEKEKTAFCCKYTALVRGAKYMGDILDSWEKLVKYEEEQTRAASNHREDEGDTTDNAATTFDKEEQTGAMSNYREEDEEHQQRRIKKLNRDLADLGKQHLSPNISVSQNIKRPRTLHDDEDFDEEVPHTEDKEVVSGWSPDSTVSKKEDFDEETTELGEKIESMKKVKQSSNYTALTLRASQDKRDSGRDEDNLPERQQGQDALQIKEHFHMLYEARLLKLGMLEGGPLGTRACRTVPDNVVMENEYPQSSQHHKRRRSSSEQGGSNGGEKKQRKKRAYLWEEKTEKLQASLLQHPKNPYPTQEQKQTLASEAGLEIGWNGKGPKSVACTFEWSRCTTGGHNDIDEAQYVDCRRCPDHPGAPPSSGDFWGCLPDDDFRVPTADELNIPWPEPNNRPEGSKGQTKEAGHSRVNSGDSEDPLQWDEERYRKETAELVEDFGKSTISDKKSPAAPKPNEKGKGKGRR
ncbi:unnamed protein product [Sphagnum balticum]